jgi:hypothetical protein
MPEVATSVMPPKWKHRSHDEDLYQWTERGAEWPNDLTAAGVYYTYKFCPGRGDRPDDVDHVCSCPVVRSPEDPGTQDGGSA